MLQKKSSVGLPDLVPSPSQFSQIQYVAFLSKFSKLPSTVLGVIIFSFVVSPSNCVLSVSYIFRWKIVPATSFSFAQGTISNSSSDRLSGHFSGLAVSSARISLNCGPSAEWMERLTHMVWVVYEPKRLQFLPLRCVLFPCIVFNDCDQHPSCSSHLFTWSFTCTNLIYWSYAPQSSIAFLGPITASSL